MNTTDESSKRRESRFGLGPVAIGWAFCFALALLWGGSVQGADAKPLERWIYCSENLLVDRNVDALETLLRRAAKAGYTHVLLTDSKFSRLGEMDERYFAHARRIKELAQTLGLELVPALFPIGYSNDLLGQNPNLIEALPVRDLELIIRKGAGEPVDPPELRGGDMNDLGVWDWHDATVTQDDGAAKMTITKDANSRIAQKIRLKPFHPYHLSVRIRSRDLHATPEVKVLTKEGRALNYQNLGVKSNQDWTEHHVVFNSLDHSEATLYLGCWGGSGGEVWWDDLRWESAGFLNVVRRPGAPLSVRRDDDSALTEGNEMEFMKDPRMGTVPWKGEYEVWHEPPVLRTSLPDGTRLKASFYHAITIYDGQAMICPSEPETVALLKDQARRMHALWGAKGYMMSHDEIRVLNWCGACEARHLDAGAILADNVRTCIGILRTVNPGGRIYVWSDMFDPNHNARDDYYLVRGNLAGSWEGLDPDVVIVPWYFEKRRESLAWFAGRGHRQVIAGYYDHDPEQVRDWLEAAKMVKGVDGVMYTTWRHAYGDLERFARLIQPER